jgi:hypothetical protein
MPSNSIRRSKRQAIVLTNDERIVILMSLAYTVATLQQLSSEEEQHGIVQQLLGKLFDEDPRYFVESVERHWPLWPGNFIEIEITQEPANAAAA